MNMCRDYSFEPEKSDYAEDYWLEDGVDEEDFALLHLTNALETINNAPDKWGEAGQKATAAIENVINKYFQPKE